MRTHSLSKNFICLARTVLLENHESKLGYTWFVVISCLYFNKESMSYLFKISVDTDTRLNFENKFLVN